MFLFCIGLTRNILCKSRRIEPAFMCFLSRQDSTNPKLNNKTGDMMFWGRMVGRTTFRVFVLIKVNYRFLLLFVFMEQVFMDIGHKWSLNRLYWTINRYR